MTSTTTATMTPETVSLLRRASELLFETEDCGLRRERDQVAAALLELAQASCVHPRRYRSVCCACLQVERDG